jgi:hypothetical protein
VYSATAALLNNSFPSAAQNPLTLLVLTRSPSPLAAQLQLPSRHAAAVVAPKN